MCGPAVAYPVVFGAGFSILLLEITAGRLLAPAVGVSLETWTGIIGVVLAGFALGDALGGALADRLPSPRLLAGIVALAGAGVVTVVPLAGRVGGLLPSAPVFLRVILIGSAVLLVPSTRRSSRSIPSASCTADRRGWKAASTSTR